MSLWKYIQMCMRDATDFKGLNTASSVVYSAMVYKFIHYIHNKYYTKKLYKNILMYCCIYPWNLFLYIFEFFFYFCKNKYTHEYAHRKPLIYIIIALCLKDLSKVFETNAHFKCVYALESHAARRFLCAQCIFFNKRFTVRDLLFLHVLI